MDLVAKELLINFLFILLPLFLLQMFYLYKYAYRFEEGEKWIFTAFPFLSIALCMLFPYAFGEEFTWDLRGVPFLIGALYGGPQAGLLLLALILVIRFFIGGDGFYITLVSYPLLTLLLFILSKHYLQFNLKQKIVVNTVLICLFSFVPLFFSDIIFGLNMRYSMKMEYLAFNLVGMITAMLLLEVIRTNFNVLQKLIKAEKMEVVSHLSASISHEVRNPLTASRGFIQLLSEEEDEQVRKQYVEVALAELDRASEIINDYLTFAKPTIDKKEKMNVFEEVDYVLNVITPLANMNGVVIKLEGLDKEDFQLLGERLRFRQCLINIMKNGVESMPNGGLLRITVHYTFPYIHLNICDEGKGMTKEQIARLGEPYFTTKEKGTGLGMMVAYSVIKGMNGEVKVKSEYGKYSCFSIKLPVSLYSK